MATVPSGSVRFAMLAPKGGGGHGCGCAGISQSRDPGCADEPGSPGGMARFVIVSAGEGVSPRPVIDLADGGAGVIVCVGDSVSRPVVRRAVAGSVIGLTVSAGGGSLARRRLHSSRLS